MMMTENEIVEFLKQSFGDKILEIESPRERRIFSRIKQEDLKKVVAFIRDDLQITHLSTITASDLGDEIELIYHFVYEGAIVLSIVTEVPMDEPKIPTIVDIIPGSQLYEREVYEMMGVVFEGHPNLEPLLLPEDWPKGVYPLRKEYDLEKLRELNKDDTA
jgi:NADH:ubiquinone oxidoreductase subunit C